MDKKAAIVRKFKKSLKLPLDRIGIIKMRNKLKKFPYAAGMYGEDRKKYASAAEKDVSGRVAV